MVFYDQTDFCPVCHGKLIPVTYYSGDVVDVNTNVSRNFVEKVTTTTTKYTNLSSHQKGYCKACSEKQYLEMEQKRVKCIKRNFIIISGLLALCAVLMVFLIGLETNPIQSNGLTSVMPFLMDHGVRILSFVILSFLAFCFLLYIIIRRKDMKMNPFHLPDGKELSASAAIDAMVDYTISCGGVPKKEFFSESEYRNLKKW